MKISALRAPCPGGDRLGAGGPAGAARVLVPALLRLEEVRGEVREGRVLQGRVPPPRRVLRGALLKGCCNLHFIWRVKRHYVHYIECQTPLYALYRVSNALVCTI